ncbi:hypothetical protein B0H10DRAFT_1952182 [Mycena sp. CBHHK59/15]|nr:hypothetical protein B0H10DRAFT_1952182 [Mycena sp. CBHHK59/15]
MTRQTVSTMSVKVRASSALKERNTGMGTAREPRQALEYVYGTGTGMVEKGVRVRVRCASLVRQYGYGMAREPRQAARLRWGPGAGKVHDRLRLQINTTCKPDAPYMPGLDGYGGSIRATSQTFGPEAVNEPNLGGCGGSTRAIPREVHGLGRRSSAISGSDTGQQKKRQSNLKWTRRRHANKSLSGSRLSRTIVKANLVQKASTRQRVLTAPMDGSNGRSRWPRRGGDERAIAAPDTGRGARLPPVVKHNVRTSGSADPRERGVNIIPTMRDAGTARKGKPHVKVKVVQRVRTPARDRGVDKLLIWAQR